MARSPKALANPDLLVWAREAARLAPEQAAERAGLAVELLQAWERGEGHPSIAQLRKLGDVYKRPLAVFFLPRRPKKYGALVKDFRRLPDAGGHVSPELEVEVRRAVARRETALELYALAGERLPAFGCRLARTTPEVAASVLRKFLAVSIESQVAWGPNRALRGWRAVIERAGVLVGQSFRIPLEEMRGFSISETPFPVIVLNPRDLGGGRVFTLMHEFAHVALREGGICDLHDKTSHAQDPEVFCNRVASAALMPRDDLLAQVQFIDHRGDTWEDDEIKRLARRYGVSRAALLVRLRTLRRAGARFVDETLERYDAELKALRAARKEAPVPHHVKIVNRVGLRFSRLVLDSFHAGRITASDVADYLNVRLNYLPKVENEVFGRSEVAA